MTSAGPAHPGGRRPPGRAVYWRRRLFVLGVLAALVLTIVNVVAGPEPRDGVSASVTAADLGADGTEDPGATTGPTAEGRRDRKGRGGGRGDDPEDPAGIGPSVLLPTAPPLADPSGECLEEDILVTPTVRRAEAGRSAVVDLGLRTGTTEACTWQVSAESLAIRVSVGEDEVWASRHCPSQVAEQEVVVRRAVSTSIRFRWNTRRSDEECPRYTEYAEPGEYRVTAGALGALAEPGTVVFDLPAPVAAPEPEPEPTSGADRLERDQGERLSGG